MDRCKFYIKAQENWELVKIYKDPAESGDKWKRPDLQEMLYDVRNDEIDVVVTIKLDRISRSVQDFHRILEIFEENKVSLVSVTQGFDTGNRQAGLPLTGTPLEKGRMTHLPLRVLLSRGELQAVDRGLPKI
jgi:DNA invertase Pin-like site-specific DNA recombinase